MKIDLELIELNQKKIEKRLKQVEALDIIKDAIQLEKEINK